MAQIYYTKPNKRKRTLRRSENGMITSINMVIPDYSYFEYQRMYSADICSGLVFIENGIYNTRINIRNLIHEDQLATFKRRYIIKNLDL